MAGPFASALRMASEAQRDALPERERRWIYVPYDQLSDELGPLSKQRPESLGIILVESVAKAERRPYHQQKLAWILANGRRFALEQAARGVAVRHVVTLGGFAQGVEQALDALGVKRAQVMRPAERELRQELAPLVAAGRLEELPHTGWLTTPEDFSKSQGARKQWLMDAFYKHVRRRYQILMTAEGKPEGGKFSFDQDNREPWYGSPPAPEPPRFEPDEITQEVGQLIQARFGHHPGRLELERLPTTREHAQQVWAWAKRECLPWFGPYEDAMSARSRTLFHTLTSPLLNLHRLLPAQLVREAVQAELPLQSKEGFVRQILGWREFMRHVHESTEGFRQMPLGRPRWPVAERPGDGGYQSWAGRPWPGASLQEASIQREAQGASGELARAEGELDGGVAPEALGPGRPVPPAFWGQPSGLRCLDTVVESVWQTGYAHHIERLMVLSNLATLLDLSPRQITDWFWVGFIDAYDWVVEPNVLGMGTFGVGDLFTTKPYVAGSAYIHKMSDLCQGCAFKPGKSCPITPLYWAFLARQREVLRGNPRLGVVLAALERRDEALKQADAQLFERISQALARGQRWDQACELSSGSAPGEPSS